MLKVNSWVKFKYIGFILSVLLIATFYCFGSNVWFYFLIRLALNSFGSCPPVPTRNKT